MWRTLMVIFIDYINRLKQYQRDRLSVEKETVGKKHNNRWHEIRQDLLPSSFFHRIVNAKNRKSYKNILQELMYTKSEFGNSAAIKHQRLVERDALIVFTKLFADQKLIDCGLFIDKDLYFLCTSPLKLYGKNHILNVKCPLKQHRKKFEEVINKLPFWKEENGSMTINKKSDWYIELQSELRITRKAYGFIMVWLGEYMGEPQYRIVEVPRDDEFFETQVKPELEYFYNEVMIKELVHSRKERYMILREYNAQTDSYE